MSEEKPIWNWIRMVFIFYLLFVLIWVLGEHRNAPIIYSISIMFILYIIWDVFRDWDLKYQEQTK